MASYLVAVFPPLSSHTLRWGSIRAGLQTCVLLWRLSVLHGEWLAQESWLDGDRRRRWQRLPVVFPMLLACCLALPLTVPSVGETLSVQGFVTVSFAQESPTWGLPLAL